ncbi:MAG: branched-chain amino acid ABC transporter permease [Eubacteriales bacterium]
MKHTVFAKTPVKYILNTVCTAAVITLLVLLTSGGALNNYQTDLLKLIGINIILAVSLNLAAGFLGQLPLGHAGFMSIGAYAAALFSKSVALPANIEFPMALLVGGLFAAAFGVIIGLPALRLHGDYLAILTLGFGEIIRVIIQNMTITGGASGLRGIEKHTSIFWVYLMVAATIFVITTFIRSRHGRAVLAIREDEIAAEASGIPTTRYKVMAFTISAFFAGIAGGLYAHYLSILDAANFGFMKSVEILVMVVLGGLGSIIGSVVAATGLTLLPELLRGFSDYRMVIYSLLLVVVMIFKPSGLFGKYDFSLGGTLDSAILWLRSPNKFHTVREKIAKLKSKKGGKA